ncbi:MAG TPA: TMEM165/GDT1 family protein [Mycobacteriales bacterium]|nr:TMEM165/GDT1 family protein [Mycobacteriales bacterium]
MRLGVVLATFALVFPAELPDKTTLATLVLSTRYRALPVWLGACAAFAVQVTLAVTVGGLLSRLPHRVTLAASAVLFAVGAVLALRGGDGDGDAEDEVGETRAATSGPRIAGTAFGVLLVAEFGDFTQLATATLAARYGAPLSVGLGAWLALVGVSGLAALLGRGLLRVVPVRAVRIVAACVFAAVAVVSAGQAVGG